MDYTYIAPRATLRDRLAYDARILQVLARAEFRLKYAGSILGYVWSLAKPMMYFAVLWVVFGSSAFNSGIARYPLYLLIGIVLNTFLVDAVSLALPSIATSGPTIRRISFPPIVIPLASSLATAMTFLANCVVVVIFLLADGVRPGWDWLLLIPLLLELYVFVLAIAIVCGTLYVKFRDIGQIWQVTAPLLFFTAPIMYPITVLPEWARKLAELNPFVQTMQDIRSIILGPDAIAAGASGDVVNRIFPIAIAFLMLAVSLLVYRRAAPRFAELA
jgi:ABC-2 type transport system permease protein